MKLIKSILPIAAVIYLVFIISCTGDETPSLNQQQQAAKILDEGSPWGGNGNVDIESVPGGVDPSELAGLQISFSSSGESDWAPTYFEASGADDFLSTNNTTWIWTGSGTDNITLNDASVAELTSVDVTDESITFTFEVTPSSGGRTTGIDGTYRLKLQ